MDFFKVGQVLKPQGIRGEVKIRPFVDDLGRFDSIDHIFMKKRGEYLRYDVESARTYKDFAYIKIGGVNDRNEAELLRGAFFYIDRKNASPLPEGAHYVADLIGMELRDGNGEVLGTVADIMNTGSADIYTVTGKGRFMFPKAPGVITNVDEKAGVIYVDDRRLSEVRVDG